MIKKYESKIVKYEHMNNSVIKITLMLEEDLNFKAGQYITIVFTNPDGERISRMYSIASSTKDKRSLDLCIKLIENGSASNIIKNLKLGNDIFFVGPAGKFVLTEESKEKDIFFISSGTGITPFISMFHELIDTGYKNTLTFINGFRDENDILFTKEISSLRKNDINLKLLNILSRPLNQNIIYKGHVQDFLSTIILKRQLQNSHFYICGLKDMIDSVSLKLKELGVKDEQIFLEEYD